MDRENVMSVPRLTDSEYNDVVEDWNRRVKRGGVEPCVEHLWARVPTDSDDAPRMICVYCTRTYQPDVRRMDGPLTGRGAMPPRGQGEPM